MASSTSTAKKDKSRKSAFALPSTSAAVPPSSSNTDDSKPDPVQGLQHSFQNCVEQLKVGPF